MSQIQVRMSCCDITLLCQRWLKKVRIFQENYWCFVFSIRNTETRVC